MKYLSALIVVTLIMTSCSNEPKSEYQQLFSTFEADPKPETYQPLMEATVDKVKTLELDNPERKEALETGYKASNMMNNQSQAVGYLNTFIRDYPNDESTPDKLFELGSRLKKANKGTAATTILQGFVAEYPNHEKAAEAKGMIPEGAMSPEETLKQLAEDMFQNNEGQLNRQASRNFVDVCEAYALTHPGNPKSADYLHKAAETARAMRTIPKALGLYDWILEKYPNHEKAPQALFLKAFTYDNNLNDVENARKNYEAFLAKYPEDDFADDTKFLLENLGKSDEEILEALTKKTQK